ncbi:MAG: T9SS type A sorting domain-containing protein [Bacteroidetes bacterium]|nr:T9SS type A sorting domain-containing protein [Bacteroidota bacterium]
MDFKSQVVYPLNYVYGNPTDSIVIKCTITTKPSDTCFFNSPWVCSIGDTINIGCWPQIPSQGLKIYGHDACLNTAVCQIDFFNNGVLPVELESFTSEINGNNVTLNWATLSEKSNSGFHVERYSGSKWTDLSFISGKGNITERTLYSFVDRGLQSGTYNYRLKQVDFNGNFKYIELEGAVNVGKPETFSLSQNYPNPFNPSTTINYALPKDGMVTLKLYDLNGREIKVLVNETKSAGFYTLNFNASDLSSGVYFYKLESGNFITAKKMILMK